MVKKHDLHNHTTYSDGHASPEEMIKAAVKAGVEIFGITDHAFTKKLPSIDYASIDLSNIEGYLKDLKNLQSKTKDLDFLVGIEIDVSLSYGTAPSELPIDILNRFDYVLFEYVNDTGVDIGRQRSIDEVLNIRDDIKKPVGLAHSNLSRNWFREEEKIADILSRYDIYFEINESRGNYLSFSDKMLKALNQYDVKVVAGTDSHHPRTVGNIDRALGFIEKNKLNIHEIVGG